MKETKRNLKVLSYVILALAAYSLIRVALDIFLFTDFSSLPEGATATTVLIGQITVIVVSFLLLLPQVYVGVKGIKVSNTPDSSKAHIVWAIILAVFSAIGVVGAVSDLVGKNGELVGNLLETADMVIDVCLYITYAKYAKQIRKAA